MPVPDGDPPPETASKPSPAKSKPAPEPLPEEERLDTPAEHPEEEVEPPSDPTPAPPSGVEEEEPDRKRKPQGGKKGQPVPHKSLQTAYLLWLFLGLVGGHRFYLGRWLTGGLYAISLGFYGVGWVLDLFLLPWLVRWTNEERQHRLEHQEHVEPVEELPPPAWALRPSLIRQLDFPFQILFFAVAPCVLTMAAAMLEQWELLLLLVATLAMCGFLRNVDGVARRYPAVDKVPMLNHVLGYLRNFTELYREQAPRSFFYYLFYPITAPIFLLFSAPARREFKVFGRLIGGFMMVVAARIGFS
jgi:TM2 domain-containing membrane protein YozV